MHNYLDFLDPEIQEAGYTAEEAHLCVTMAQHRPLRNVYWLRWPAFATNFNTHRQTVGNMYDSEYSRLGPS